MNKLPCLIVILLLSVYWDYRKGIIPNKLIALGFILGIIILFYNREIYRIFQYIPGILIPIILLFPLYKIGGIGAGDIKLISMLGLYLSFPRLIFSIILIFIISAFLSLLKMIYYKNFWERMTYLSCYVRRTIKSGKFQYYYQNINEEETIRETKIGLAAPIFLAVMITGGIL